MSEPIPVEFVGVDAAPFGVFGNVVRGPAGANFQPDATGLLADRADFDAEAPPFAFLATDTGDLYFREGVTAGGWSAPVAFGGGGGSGSGDVLGPSSSVDGRAVVFDGTTGKRIRQAAAAPVLEGDARLTDARTPSSHAASHGDGGSDEITVTQDQVTGLGMALSAKADAATLATVATSGAYEDLSGRPTLGTAAATDATDYAPAAQGVTNGDSHDHSGGDGAQIAYGSLSGLPTLGSAAAAATGDFAPAGHVGSGGTAHANAVASGAAGFMTGADKAKLDGVASGAEVNVNSDWNASSGDAQILNKPTLGDSASRNVGTGAGTVAAGNDSRFHDSVTLGAALTPVFSLTGQALGAVDHGADRLLFWDDSAGTLAPLTLGTNLSITGTTINATGGSGGGDVSLSGTPVAGQAAEWTNGTTIQGVAVTGTGSYVKGTAPTITLPNATGLPLSTGISGLGTGIAAALAINTGSAGAPVLFNGAGGTPSSLTLTNATGLPATGIGDSTAAGRSLLTAADAAAQRTSLGLGTLATQSGTFSGTSSGTNTGDQTITLTGEATGSGTGSFAATLSNSAVIGKVLTGYTPGAGTVAATDTILQAIQKLDGNDAAFLTSSTAASTYQPLDSDLTSIAALTTTTYGRSQLTLADAAADTAQLNVFSSSLKGLAPASGGGTSNFLRADGTWAAPGGGGATNLTYTAATRVIASDTGTDATLPLVSSGDAGLAPASGGGTNKTLQADGTWAARPIRICIACSDETTALTTGTNKVRFRMPQAMTLTAVRATVNTAPTGSTLVVDINEGDTPVSILSTKLSIDATEKTSTTAATAAVISDSALADDAEISIDIDQIGATVAGAGLKVWLIGTEA